MGIVNAATGIEQVVPFEPTSYNGETLRRVFTRSADALYRFILVRVRGNKDTAEELLQQMCYEAVRHRDPPGRSDECEAWLRGIARNLIRRHWRRLKKQASAVSIYDATIAEQLADQLESGSFSGDGLIKQEMFDQLLLAVTSLPAADQSLIFAYYFEGRSQADLANDLGVTEKSIESRLYRARSRLREALRDTESAGEL
ncbi:MAG: sigma-70 family RNA polymerase sigma factor [Phycisphaerales bacterium]|nr:MAG: sigma-70 family RNA polymerase sigma factor [Phycisphaerales bacterium]